MGSLKAKGTAGRRGRRPTRSPDPAGSSPDPGRTALAHAAIGAIEPLVELFLELGITSPEVESLLRGVYVHKSREWLAKREGGELPSDVRIALITGVHRNFVRRLLAAPPQISAARERKRHRAGRLLAAWHRDPLYLDSDGKPRDLPARGVCPSFEALVTQHVPGAPLEAMIGELRRAGVIQMLAENRVRVRSRTVRLSGLDAGNIKELGKRSAAYLRTLIHNLREPNAPLLNERVLAVGIDQERVPIVRGVIYRRVSAFLRSLEGELASEGKGRGKRGKRRIAVFAFEADISEADGNVARINFS